MSNDPIDLASWPELDEVDVVAVLPSYARARALVWGLSAVLLALLLIGPLEGVAPSRLLGAGARRRVPQRLVVAEGDSCAVQPHPTQ